MACQKVLATQPSRMDSVAQVKFPSSERRGENPPSLSFLQRFNFLLQPVSGVSLQTLSPPARVRSETIIEQCAKLYAVVRRLTDQLFYAALLNAGGVFGTQHKRPFLPQSSRLCQQAQNKEPAAHREQ